MFNHFRIVRDDRSPVGILARDVIAVLGKDGEGWYDPHGGEFSDADKSDFYEVAFGRKTMVSLKGHGFVPCRLVADF